MNVVTKSSWEAALQTASPKGCHRLWAHDVTRRWLPPRLAHIMGLVAEMSIPTAASYARNGATSLDTCRASLTSRPITRCIALTPARGSLPPHLGSPSAIHWALSNALEPHHALYLQTPQAYAPSEAYLFLSPLCERNPSDLQRERNIIFQVHAHGHRRNARCQTVVVPCACRRQWLARFWCVCVAPPRLYTATPPTWLVCRLLPC